jgi:hypothetical protein
LSANPKLLQLDKINKQIIFLKEKQTKIEQQLETKIINIFKKHKAFNHDFEILSGMILDGLLQLENKNVDKSLLDKWQNLGISFNKNTKNIKNIF